MGASSVGAFELLRAAEEATHAGRPAWFYCDGSDALVCCADEGESVAELLRAVALVLPDELRGLR